MYNIIIIDNKIQMSWSSSTGSVTSVSQQLFECVNLKLGGTEDEHKVSVYKYRLKIQSVNNKKWMCLSDVLEKALGTVPQGICCCPFVSMAAAFSHVTSSKGGTCLWIWKGRELWKETGYHHSASLPLWVLVSTVSKDGRSWTPESSGS